MISRYRRLSSTTGPVASAWMASEAGIVQHSAPPSSNGGCAAVQRGVVGRKEAGGPAKFDGGSPMSIVDEAPKDSAPMRVPELTQRLGLNLADPFAGHRELLADFSKRMVGARPDPEAHPNYPLFARTE